MGNSEAKAKRAELMSLIHSSPRGNIQELCEFLVQPGVDVNARNTRTGETPLMYAVSDGSLECVNTLITAGADVNASDRAGWTALLHATSDGSEDNIKALLAAGANVNKKTKKGYTALWYAPAWFPSTHCRCSDGCRS